MFKSFKNSLAAAITFVSLGTGYANASTTSEACTTFVDVEFNGSEIALPLEVAEYVQDLMAYGERFHVAVALIIEENTKPDWTGDNTCEVA